MTLTATVKAVAPGSGTATGTAQFFRRVDAARVAGRFERQRKGNAKSERLSVGSQSITAVYSGDSSFGQHLTGADPDRESGCHNNDGWVVDEPAVLRSDVTLTATVKAVAPGSGTATGTAQFFDGSTPLGSPVALNPNGKATLKTSTLAVASHAITAVTAATAALRAAPHRR